MTVVYVKQDLISDRVTIPKNIFMLTDFFRINMPYGMKKNAEGEWMFFNREYVPLGWNSTESHHKSEFGDFFSALPVYTNYKGLTESKLEKLAWGVEGVQRNQKGEIDRVFFYNDRTNPMNDSKYWPDYIERIKALSKCTVTRKLI